MTDVPVSVESGLALIPLASIRVHQYRCRDTIIIVEDFGDLLTGDGSSCYTVFFTYDGLTISNTTFVSGPDDPDEYGASCLRSDERALSHFFGIDLVKDQMMGPI